MDHTFATLFATLAPELQDHVLSFAGHHALKKMRLAAGGSHPLYEQATTRLFHTLDMTTRATRDPLPAQIMRKCFERLAITTYAKIRVLEVCISSAPGTEGEHPDIYARYALAILQRLSALQKLNLSIRYRASLTSVTGVCYFLQALAAMEPKFEVGLAYHPGYQSTGQPLDGGPNPALSEVLTSLNRIPFTLMHIELQKAICEDLFIAQVPLKPSSLSLRGIRAHEGLLSEAWDRVAEDLIDLTCIQTLFLDWAGSGDSENALFMRLLVLCSPHLRCLRLINGRTDSTTLPSMPQLVSIFVSRELSAVLNKLDAPMLSEVVFVPSPATIAKVSTMLLDGTRLPQLRLLEMLPSYTIELESSRQKLDNLIAICDGRGISVITPLLVYHQVSSLGRPASIAEALHCDLLQPVERTSLAEVCALDRCTELLIQCKSPDRKYSLVKERLPGGQAADIFRSISRAPVLEVVTLILGEDDEEGSLAVRELVRAIDEGRLGNPRFIKGSACFKSTYTTSKVVRQVETELASVCEARGIRSTLEFGRGVGYSSDLDSESAGSP